MCSPPRLERRLQRQRHVRRAQTRAGAPSCSRQSSASGRARRRGGVSATTRPSPGHGRHSGTSRSRAGGVDDGMPESRVPDRPHVDAPHLDPRSDCRRDQRAGATSARAPSATRPRCACGAMMTSALPPTTRTSAVVTCSPGEERDLEHDRRARRGQAHDPRARPASRGPRAERPLDAHERGKNGRAARRRRPPPPRPGCASRVSSQVVVGEPVLVDARHGPARGARPRRGAASGAAERHGSRLRHRPVERRSRGARATARSRARRRRCEQATRVPAVEEHVRRRPISRGSGQRHR